MTHRFGLKIAVAIIFVAVSLPLMGQTAADSIRQGDEYYAKFNNAQALEEYLKAAKAEPENYEALWKTARAYYDVSDIMTPADAKAKDEQRRLYGESMKFARQAIKVNPNDTWGHFFLSAAWGMYVLTQGKKEQVNASKQIKIEISAIDIPTDIETYDVMWHVCKSRTCTHKIYRDGRYPSRASLPVIPKKAR